MAAIKAEMTAIKFVQQALQLRRIREFIKDIAILS